MLCSSDIETRSLLVRERQAELRRDAVSASVGRRDVVESVGPRREPRLPRLRVRALPARGAW